jgi:hypothetical protein
MNEYRRRLERTQIKFCVLLILLLFTGLLILPRIGQVVWIAIIAAIYIRVTLIIARREELLEEQSAARQDNQRLAPHFHRGPQRGQPPIPSSRGSTIVALPRRPRPSALS